MRDRVLKVIGTFPRSTALIKFALNKDGGEHVSLYQVRKELNAMQSEGLVRCTPYPYHKGQLEWRLEKIEG